MSMFLKVVEEEWSPVPADNVHAVYGDVTSCSFRRYEDGSGAEALIYCREPVKTAVVPGFHEVEKHVSFTGTAYLMNEQGRTISSFTAKTSGQSAPQQYAGVRNEAVS